MNLADFMSALKFQRDTMSDEQAQDFFVEVVALCHKFEGKPEELGTAILALVRETADIE